MPSFSNQIIEYLIKRIVELEEKAKPTIYVPEHPRVIYVVPSAYEEFSTGERNCFVFSRGMTPVYGGGVMRIRKLGECEAASIDFVVTSLYKYSDNCTIASLKPCTIVVGKPGGNTKLLCPKCGAGIEMAEEVEKYSIAICGQCSNALVYSSSGLVIA